jgi:hypothetical protein
MTNDKPSKITKNLMVEHIKRRLSGIECSSTREASDVKTSIPEPKRQNSKNAVGRSKPSLNDGKEYHIRMSSTTLLSDPFFINFFLLSIILDTGYAYSIMKEFKYFRDHLSIDFELINEPQSGYSSLRDCFFGLDTYLKSLTQDNSSIDSPYLFDANDLPELEPSSITDPFIDMGYLPEEDELFFIENPNDLDISSIDPNYLFDANDLPEPGPSTIIDPLIKNGYLLPEDALVFMEKFFIYVNPSKPSGERIRYDGPILELVTLINLLFFLRLLNVSVKKFKRPRDEDEDISRPIFFTFIINHISLTKHVDPSTIFRCCKEVYYLFSGIRDRNRSRFDMFPKKELLRFINDEKEKPSSFKLKMNKKRYEIFKSVCRRILE